jgi:hypothetical protein
MAKARRSSNISNSQNKKKRKASQVISPSNDANHNSKKSKGTPSAPLEAPKPRKPQQSLETNETLACVASPWGPIQTSVLSHVLQDVVLERFQKELIERYPCWLSHSKQAKPRRKRPMKEENDDGNITNDGSIEIMDHHEKQQQSFSDDERMIQSIFRSRILMGTNQCTRALEAAIHARHQQGVYPSSSQEVLFSNTATTTPTATTKAPSLIIMARDVYPPTMLAHIPVMARQVGTPIVLLPRNASLEMGKLLYTRRVAIVAFLPPQTPAPGECTTAAETKINSSNPSLIETCDGGDNGSDVAGTHVALLVHAAVDSFVDFVRSKL